MAKEFVAFANTHGGTVLLGIEDDGPISGVKRKDLQRWLMDSVFGRNIHPVIFPFYEEVAIDVG